MPRRQRDGRSDGGGQTSQRVIASLAGNRFRTNPRLLVTAWADLQSEQRDRLHELCADPDFFGTAGVRRIGESLKAIDNQTAALLRELSTPAPLPIEARRLLREDVGPLLRLLLDDFLQVEANGDFVAGPAALELFPEFVDATDAADPLTSLSDDALRYAALLRGTSVRAVESRLYTFNGAPADPTLRRFEPPSAAAHALGLTSHARLGRLISRTWVGPVRFSASSWWTFTQPNAPPSELLRFKVYISAGLDDMRRALEIAVPVLIRHDCPAFKIGAGLLQLLRPDKFVAYFANRDDMLRCAVALAHALKLVHPQGVPFTASAGGSASVSWGVDPPADAKLLSWQAQDSWRTWVTRRLARYLVIARHNSSRYVASWQFARTRLKLDGVDTTRWVARDQAVGAPETVEAPVP